MTKKYRQYTTCIAAMATQFENCRERLVVWQTMDQFQVNTWHLSFRSTLLLSASHLKFRLICLWAILVIASQAETGRKRRGGRFCAPRLLHENSKSTQRSRNKKRDTIPQEKRNSPRRGQPRSETEDGIMKCSSHKKIDKNKLMLKGM